MVAKMNKVDAIMCNGLWENLSKGRFKKAEGRDTKLQAERTCTEVLLKDFVFQGQQGP